MIRLLHSWCFSHGGSSSSSLCELSSVRLIMLPAVLLSCLASGSCAAPAAGGNSWEDVSNTVVNAVRREGVDSTLLRYAFLAQPGQQPDGVVYDVALTPFLRSGIEAQAMRTDAAGLRGRGPFTFNEFNIPAGGEFDDDSNNNNGNSNVMLIYRRIFNFTVYSLPPGYQFVGPVVGVAAYSPPNFTAPPAAADALPIIFPSHQQVSIKLPLPSTLSSSPPSSSIACAFFVPNGTAFFTNPDSSSSPSPDTRLCAWDSIGVADVALVLPGFSPTSPPSSSSSSSSTFSNLLPPSFSSPAAGSSGGGGSSTRNARKWKVALGATALAFAGAGLCAAMALAVWSAGLVDKAKVAVLSRLAPDNEEALQTSLIGISRAPTAAGVRTKPTLEMDMARF